MMSTIPATSIGAVLLALRILHVALVTRSHALHHLADGVPGRVDGALRDAAAQGRLRDHLALRDLVAHLAAHHINDERTELHVFLPRPLAVGVAQGVERMLFKIAAGGFAQVGL